MANTPVHFFVNIFRTIVAIIKIPFFIIIFTFFFMSHLATQIIPSEMFKRIFTRGVSIVLFRFLLFLTGNVQIYEAPSPLGEAYFEITDLPNPCRGDLIICNFASYLNLFWLQYEYSPLYAIPISSDEVIIKSTFSLLASIWGNYPLSKGKTLTLGQALTFASKQYSPLVIFPEGIPSNGQQITKFFEFGSKVDFSNIHIHVIGFINKSTGISPNYVMDKKGNALFHLFMMLGRSFATMKVFHSLPQNIPSANNGIDMEWIMKVRELLSKILDLPKVDAEPPDFFYQFKIHSE